jgi:hypothetical protein
MALVAGAVVGRGLSRSILRYSDPKQIDAEVEDMVMVVASTYAAEVCD